MFLLRSWWARFLIAALLAAVLLVPRLSVGRAAAWSAFLAAVAATGIGLIRLSGRERADMKLVDRSDGQTALRDGTRIAVCGVIEPAGELLESPVWKRPAVLYHFAVLHSEQSSPGVSDTLKDVVDFAGYGATPARVVGPTRSAGLGGFPVLYEFESKYIDADAARHNMRDYLRQARIQ